MKKGSSNCKDYPTKQVAMDKLDSRSAMANKGDPQKDMNRIRNQYAKNPPVNDDDFMGAFSVGRMSGPY